MTARTRIIQRVKEVCSTAQSLFGVNLSNIQIVIRNCGKAAGKASCLRYGSHVTDLTLILNSQLVNDQDASKLMEEVIPHEIAHLVCFVRPELGKNHNRGWSRVCIQLGGSGARCHRYDLAKARRTRKAVYDINGFIMDVGLTVHRKIQAGASYSYACQHSGRRVRISPDHFTGKVKLV